MPANRQDGRFAVGVALMASAAEPDADEPLIHRPQREFEYVLDRSGGPQPVHGQETGAWEQLGRR